MGKYRAKTITNDQKEAHLGLGSWTSVDIFLHLVGVENRSKPERFKDSPKRPQELPSQPKDTSRMLPKTTSSLDVPFKDSNLAVLEGHILDAQRLHREHGVAPKAPLIA